MWNFALPKGKLFDLRSGRQFDEFPSLNPRKYISYKTVERRGGNEIIGITEASEFEATLEIVENSERARAHWVDRIKRARGGDGEGTCDLRAAARARRHKLVGEKLDTKRGWEQMMAAGRRASLPLQCTSTVGRIDKTPMLLYPDCTVRHSKILANVPIVLY